MVTKVNLIILESWHELWHKNILHLHWWSQFTWCDPPLEMYTDLHTHRHCVGVKDLCTHRHCVRVKDQHIYTHTDIVSEWKIYSHTHTQTYCVWVKDLQIYTHIVSEWKIYRLTHTECHSERSTDLHTETLCQWNSTDLHTHRYCVRVKHLVLMRLMGYQFKLISDLFASRPAFWSNESWQTASFWPLPVLLALKVISMYHCSPYIYTGLVKTRLFTDCCGWADKQTTSLTLHFYLWE